MQHPTTPVQPIIAETPGRPIKKQRINGLTPENLINDFNNCNNCNNCNNYPICDISNDPNAVALMAEQREKEKKKREAMEEDAKNNPLYWSSF